MTEVTQADELAWGDAWLAWDTNPGFVGDEAAILRIARHREQAAAEERAKIVAFLVKGRAGIIAANIEAEEHLK